MPSWTDYTGLMTIALDHLIVSARDRVASVRLLAQILGVPGAGEPHR